MKKHECKVIDLIDFIAKDAILVPESAEGLEAIFTASKIDWSNWTTPPSSLFKRIEADESMLVKRNGGKLVIITENVALKVLCPLTESTVQELCEVRQVCKGQETRRETKYTAVIRKTAKESHLNALVRCLSEKLRMKTEKIILASVRSDEGPVQAALRIWKKHRSLKDAFVVFENDTYAEEDTKSLQGLTVERRYWSYKCVMPVSMPHRLPGFFVIRKTHEDKRKTVFYQWTLYKCPSHANLPHLD